MMRAGAVIVALGLATGGCMPMAEDPIPTREDSRYVCDAAKVQNVIGQTATQALGAEAVRASGARTMRWIAPDSAYTMDFRTDRLNIHVDAQNRVIKVNCG